MTRRADIFLRVENEMRRQEELHGSLSKYDPFTWTTILTEEAGEFARAAMTDRFKVRPTPPPGHTMLDEATQIAAYMLLVIEALEDNEWAWPDTGETKCAARP
jgi:hypothetical protein